MTPSPTDLGTLIERLEKATGPDRELDLECWWWGKARHDGTRPMDPQYKADNLRMDDAPPYTSSIDAAITLARNEDEHFDMLKVYVTVGRNTGSVFKARVAAITYALKARAQENYEQVANAFGIAHQLAQEVVYMNDEAGWHDETPEKRWHRMRTWVQRHITEKKG